MSADVREIEDGKGEARETTHVYFVGGVSVGCADGVVLRALDVWEWNTPISSLFVADHAEYEGHGAV